MIKGIGIDTIEIDRIRRMYAEYGERFLNRVYAPGEQAYALRYSDPAPRLAARFAAKEACMKALGTGWSNGIRFKDIVVANNDAGKPELELFGRARERLEAIGAAHTHLSITHNRDQATAFVAFE